MTISVFSLVEITKHRQFLFLGL